MSETRAKRSSKTGAISQDSRRVVSVDQFLRYSSAYIHIYKCDINAALFVPCFVMCTCGCRSDHRSEEAIADENIPAVPSIDSFAQGRKLLKVMFDEFAKANEWTSLLRAARCRRASFAHSIISANWTCLHVYS